MLSVGIVSGILHPKYGGPVRVIQAHVRGLSPFVHIKIFGVASEDEVEVVQKILPQAQIFPKAFPSRWFYSRGLMKALIQSTAKLDIIHAHMLWDYPVLAAWLAARKAQKPFIISPHGTLLEPWRYQTLHKRIYRHVIVNKIFRYTSVVHVLNEAEASACRKLGVQCPIRVIPNGLPVEEFSLPSRPEVALDRWPVLRNHRAMLYLGRFSPEKRLEVLLKAWGKIIKEPRNKDWLLVLAGSGDSGYVTQIANLITSLNISKNVLLTGFVDGDVKKSLFDASTCFVMPSLSEGFSMAILEAMAAGLPILYTEKCNFPELAANGAGWEVGMGENDLEKGLLMVVGQDPKFMALAGREANSLR